MKKSLVITLALVFVLGIAGTAFAANPFTDVPANHWAYAAVSKLAQEGVIEGYGDGRYFGNRTITRYEMAQIVAKAMANMDKANSASRAQIEKLAAEYADELDSLGVRVAKLEKNADNVKITGEVRFSHYAFDKGPDKTPLRSRLNFTGQVNDKWRYNALIEHDNNDLHNNGNATGDNDFRFRRAWVEGKIGAVDVTAGRWQHKIYQGVVMDAADSDGIALGYKTGDFKFTVFATRPDFQHEVMNAAGTGAAKWAASVGNTQVYGATVDYGVKNFHFMLGYYNVNPSNDSVVMDTEVVKLDDSNIFELAADYKFTKEFMLWGEYLHGSEDLGGGKDGWAAGLQWSNLNKNKPGTFAVRANYFDVPASVVIDTTTELDFGANATNRGKVAAGGIFDGYKGYQLGASYMAAKNIDINIDYFDFEGQKKANGDNTLLWSYVRFYF